MATTLLAPEREALELKAKAAIELGRRRARGDLHWLAKELLGYEDLNDTLHRDELVPFITRKGRQRIVLLPRGHLKTTLATISYCAWRIIKNPSIRILIANAVEENAESFLREIKDHFQRNEKFMRFFPEFTPEHGGWSRWKTQSVTCTLRKKHTKETTVTVVGMGGALASQHYDLIIMDDLVERSHVETETQLNKAKLWYKDALDLLEPNGEMVYIGTRWHDVDLAGWLLDEHKDSFKFADGSSAIMVREDIENGKVIFPEKFNEAILEELRKLKGDWEYSCQYKNNPYPESEVIFRKAWFKFYTQSEMPRDEKGRTKPTNVYVTIDPAWTTKRTSDFTGVVVNAVTPDNHWYLLDAFRLKITSNELMGKMFEWYETYKPVLMGIELHAMQTIFGDLLPEAIQRRGIPLPIWELKPKGGAVGLESKQERIIPLQALMQNGFIHFPTLPDEHRKLASEGLEILRNQMLRFRYQHSSKKMVDNLLDALAYQQEIAQAPIGSGDLEPEVPAGAYNKFTGAIG